MEDDRSSIDFTQWRYKQRADAIAQDVDGHGERGQC